MTENRNQRNSPFVVGISGHRELHPDSLPHLRESLVSILRDLQQRLPDTVIRIMTGMAAGADLLVVEIALELGIGVEAMLPMPLSEYEADFDPSSLALLKRCLAHPQVHCLELPMSTRQAAAAKAAGISMRDARYFVLTQTLTRGCSLLIALWDGESSPLPGGTADTLLRYLGVRSDRNKDDTVLQILDAASDPEPPARVAYWIPTLRAHATHALERSAGCYLTGLSDNALLRLPTMPRRLQVHLRSLNIYNREYQRITRRWINPAAADSLMGSLPRTTVVNPGDRPALDRIDAEYGKADALAVYFQKRSNQLFRFFNAVAFTMGLSYLVYEKFLHIRMMLFTYLVILGASAALYFILYERRWFAKHLMCRALAETLRVKFYMRLASGEDLVDAEEVLSLSRVNRFHGFGWIGHVLISLAAPASGIDPMRGAGQDDGVNAWIETQCQYFVRKVTALHRDAVRTRWLKRILFAIIIGVLILLLALGKAADEPLMIQVSVEKALTFFMGLLAVTLASWELHQNKMAARELLWQYRSQLKHFTRARLQLARTFAASRRLEILAELGRDSLMESYLWTIHRFHREHEPPGPA